VRAHAAWPAGHYHRARPEGCLHAAYSQRGKCADGRNETSATRQLCGAPAGADGSRGPLNSQCNRKSMSKAHKYTHVGNCGPGLALA